MSFTKIDSDQLKDGTITDSKVSSSAAIDPHKIASSLGNSSLYDDLNATSGDASSKVSKSGDTMTGPLILAADPTQPLEATTKEYVDNNFLDLSGGTLTGPLTLNADPTNALEPATKQYVDTTFLPFSGGTLTNTLTLAADPTNDLEAATKQYVDAAISGAAGTTIIAGAFSGLAMEYIDGTTFKINIGECASDNASALISISSPVTVDITTVGVANGLDSGVVSPSTWYYVWGILDTTNDISAALVSGSSSTPTLPSGYDQKRLIGSIFIDGTSSIAYFTQVVIESTKITHITAVDITGAVGVVDLQALGKIPSTTISALIDLAIDPTSSAPSQVVISETLDASGTKLINRKTTYGTGNAGEFWVKLFSGKLNMTNSIVNSPSHIPVINLVGYMEQL
jgi:hypothetical protein